MASAAINLDVLVSPKVLLSGVVGLYTWSGRLSRQQLWPRTFLRPCLAAGRRAFLGWLIFLDPYFCAMIQQHRTNEKYGISIRFLQRGD